MRYTKLIELIPNNTFGHDDMLKSFDDTSIEKLNYRYTVVLLLSFSYLVTSKQINGARKNIQCFVPAHLHLSNDAYTDFINEYCYLSVTYYIPHNEKLVRQKWWPLLNNKNNKTSTTERKQMNNNIKYYQLTHYFLILMSILIYLPRLFYTTFIPTFCEIDLKSLTDTIVKLKCAKNDADKSTFLCYVVHYIDIYLGKSLFLRRKQQRCKLISRKETRPNSSLFLIFILMKFFYIINVVLCILFFNHTLGNEFYLFFGLSFFKNLSTNIYDSNDMNSFFPKVTLCDVMIRELGYNPKFHKIYTVQCALPINLYNQQVFTFLWFWLVFTEIVNIFDLASWSLLILPVIRKNFFKSLNLNLDKYVINKRMNKDFEEVLVISNISSINGYFYANFYNELLFEYLSIDGVFIFKLISSNFGDSIASELLHAIVIRYLEMNAKLYNHEIFYENTRIEIRELNIFKESPDSDFL